MKKNWRNTTFILDTAEISSEIPPNFSITYTVFNYTIRLVFQNLSFAHAILTWVFCISQSSFCSFLIILPDPVRSCSDPFQHYVGIFVLLLCEQSQTLCLRIECLALYQMQTIYLLVAIGSILTFLSIHDSWSAHIYITHLDSLSSHNCFPLSFSSWLQIHPRVSGQCMDKTEPHKTAVFVA